MIKFSVFICVMFLNFLAHAEQRSFIKSSPDLAVVQIGTDSAQQGVQAAQFVDGMENKQYIQMMLADKASQLARIRSQLELDSCGKESKNGEWIKSCGQVEVTDFVRTSFGRLGWGMAGASYTFFIGFRMDGSGQYFSSHYMVTVNETVEANTNNGKYSGSLNKNLGLENISKLPQKD